MKKLLLVLFVCTTFIPGLAQEESSSVLTEENYLFDPISYLSNISSAKVTSGILIDRTVYDDLILNINGTSNVTTLSSTSWIEIYNQLKYASYSSSDLDTFRIFNQTVEDYFYASETYSIGILDFKFNRIKQSAIDNGQLIEGVNYAQDVSLTTNSFSNERAIAASPLTENIQGDEVRFVVSGFFYRTNIQNEVLQSFEIDFDDGSGYQEVDFDQIVTVSYGSASGYLLIKVKLIYEDVTTHQLRTYYANSTVFRTGSATVPLPNPVPGASSNNGKVNPDLVLDYPPVVTETIRVYAQCGRQSCYRDITRVVSGGDLEVSILFSPDNTSSKLRRPFIVTDGFDPGDKRDYYSNKIQKSKTSKSNDFRGLYQLLNGDPSPWYSGQASANLIDRLRADGYDIVIINFTKGTGDIPTNATMVRNFFKNVINSATFRDNKTEEAVLVGPSMGGLITRHALATMEQNNEPHYVKAWYSFDSPHKGAYIPLALQHSVNFLAKIHTGGIGALEDAKEQFQDSKDILNTPAAKQMLLYHYSNTNSQGNPHADFTTLQNELNQLGFPTLAKNYAITNGGTGKLYPDDQETIVSLKIFSWTWVVGDRNHNDTGNHFLFEGSRQGFNNDEERSTSNQIGFENSIGGWNAALYAMNFHPKNKWGWGSLTSAPAQKGIRSAFIITSSAFGIPVTRASVYNTWKDYTASDTPFDQIKGMDVPTSEEHVRISPETADYFMSALREDFTNTTRPRIRAGEVLTQQIFGNVAYTIKEIITFAGNGNTLTAEDQANLNIKAGMTILFSPGFHAKPGSTVTAIIDAVDFSTINARQSSIASVPLDLEQKSPYLGLVQSYSPDVTQSQDTRQTSLSVYPNPTDGPIQIILSTEDQDVKGVEVVNSLGVVLSTISVFHSGLVKLDLSRYSDGLYWIFVRTNRGKILRARVLKQ